PAASTTGLMSVSASIRPTAPFDKESGREPTFETQLCWLYLVEYSRPHGNCRSERPALAAGGVPVVARVHPPGEAWIVPSEVGGDAQCQADVLRRLLRRELLAVPQAGHVDEQQIPRLHAHVLDHAFDLPVKLHELREVVRHLYAGHPRSLRR